MSPHAPGLGVQLAYEERGAGPAVLLVHGIGSTRDDWAPLAADLEPEARVISYDRRGYGESEAPEPYQRTTVAEQAEDAATLLEGLGAAPAVVCGSDLGALVCLDLIRRHRDLVRAAVLIDPALYQVSAEATEGLSAERLALEDALRDGGPERAVTAWLTAHGAPPERIDRVRGSASAFFADFSGLASWAVSRGELRALGAPVALLSSPSAAPYSRQTALAVGRLTGLEVGDAGGAAGAVRAFLAL